MCAPALDPPLMLFCEAPGADVMEEDAEEAEDGDDEGGVEAEGWNTLAWEERDEMPPSFEEEAKAEKLCVCGVLLLLGCQADAPDCCSNGLSSEEPDDEEDVVMDTDEDDEGGNDDGLDEGISGPHSDRPNSKSKEKLDDHIGLTCALLVTGAPALALLEDCALPVILVAQPWPAPIMAKEDDAEEAALEDELTVESWLAVLASVGARDSVADGGATLTGLDDIGWNACMEKAFW